MSISNTPPRSVRMAEGICGPSGISMFFEWSGVTISPFEVDIYKEDRKFDNARVRVSYEAGQLIEERVETFEPVSLWGGDTKIGRFYVPNDPIEHGMDDSHLRLLDEIKIFQEVNLDLTFHGNHSIENIIDEIFQRVQEIDEYGVIIDWQKSNVTLSDQVVRTVGSYGQGATTQAIPVVQHIELYARDRYDFLSGNAEMEFEDVTALEALYHIVDETGIDFFTKNDGVLYAGYHDDDVQIFTGSFSHETYNLIDYTVPRLNDKTKGVLVKGEEWVDDRSQARWTMSTDVETPRMMAIAARPDIEDGYYLEVEYESNNINTLRQIAENTLKNYIKQTRSGNADVDVLATNWEQLHPNEPDIREISIGDYFLVPDQGGLCQRVIPGEYYVNRIHHKINPMNGWITNLGLTRIVVELESGGFGYNKSNKSITMAKGSYRPYIDEVELP